METREQPRTIGSFLVVIALIAAVAVVWATVALASGSSAASSSSSIPAASYDGGARPHFAASGTDRDRPDEGGESTAPSTPSTTDGSTSPSL